MYCPEPPLFIFLPCTRTCGYELQRALLLFLILPLREAALWLAMLRLTASNGCVGGERVNCRGLYAVLANAQLADEPHCS